MALRLFRESVEWVALFGYRFKPPPTGSMFAMVFQRA